MEPTKIVVIDDEPVVIEGFSHGLSKYDEFKIVAKSHLSSEALELCKKHSPQILVIDIAFVNQMSGIRAAKTVREWSSDIKIVFYSIWNDLEYVRSLIRLNANGYIYKTESIENYHNIFKTIARNKLYISPEISQRLVEINEENSSGRLTPRESELLESIVLGKTNQQMSKDLNISLGTVAKHVENMRLKFKCTSKEALKNYAIKYDLVRVPPNENQINLWRKV